MPHLKTCPLPKVPNSFTPAPVGREPHSTFCGNHAGHEFNFVDLVLSAWVLANRKIKRGSRGVPRALEVEERHAESSDILGPMLITVNLCRLIRSKYLAGVAIKPQTAKPSAIRSQRLCFRPQRAVPPRGHDIAGFAKLEGGFLPTSSATRKGSAPAQTRSRLRSC